jgi:hypothetical protein
VASFRALRSVGRYQRLDREGRFGRRPVSEGRQPRIDEENSKIYVSEAMSICLYIK